ncbi:MAG: NAD(P)/FAD-dependent oxidoreductase [Rickettsiales bacterium]
MEQSHKKVVVIGTGPMGLMCAYELLKKGHQVILCERDDRIGGMTASFDFDGLQIERYYHFICSGDAPLLSLLKELNIEHAIRWRATKMGFYYNGKLYSWGDPFSLLKFPKLDFISKCRYALHVLYCKNIKSWDYLDKQNGIKWLKKWLGTKTYHKLWESLLYLKYYELTENLSAAWIASRIQRLAKSRKSIFSENLGFLEGGSQTLLDAMRKKIEQMGGEIHLNQAVEKIIVENNKVVGISSSGMSLECNDVISTIPLPYVPDMIPDLPNSTLEKIKNIQNIGVVCVILKLSKPISDNFWINVNDPEILVPGVIEYSNLYPMENSIVYFPYYMPNDNAKHKQSNERFVEEVIKYLEKIRPDFSKTWILSSHVSRYQYAQTVCTPDFFSMLPPMKTDIEGFYMADTSYYYPEDRSISESVRIGKILAGLL